MRRISPLDAHYKWKQVVQIQTVNISNKSHPKLLNTAMYPLEMRSVKNRSTSKPLSPSWSWFVYPHPDFRLGFAKRPKKKTYSIDFPRFPNGIFSTNKTSLANPTSLMTRVTISPTLRRGPRTNWLRCQSVRPVRELLKILQAILKLDHNFHKHGWQLNMCPTNSKHACTLQIQNQSFSRVCSNIRGLHTKPEVFQNPIIFGDLLFFWIPC